MDQLAIALLGTTAVWLSQDRREAWRRWACIAGCLGQPFWMYATWQASQYGIFALSFVYLAGWLRGVKTHWFSKNEGGAT